MLTVYPISQENSGVLDFISTLVTMMVQANGSIAFYATEKVKEADFSMPITHLNKDEFLGYSKLPTP